MIGTSLAAPRQIAGEDEIAAMIVGPRPPKNLPLTDTATIFNRGMIAHPGISVALAGDAASLAHPPGFAGLILTAARA